MPMKLITMKYTYTVCITNTHNTYIYLHTYNLCLYENNNYTQMEMNVNETSCI